MTAHRPLPAHPHAASSSCSSSSAPGATARAALALAVAHAAETLARTLHAEAGGRPVRAIEALAALVVNRARAACADPAARARYAPGAPPVAEPALLFGRVCRAPFLFNCWNPRHPAHAALVAAAPGDPALAACRRIAARAARGALHDASAGATQFHRDDRLPGWAIGQVPTAEVGGLLFYRVDQA